MCISNDEYTKKRLQNTKRNLPKFKHIICFLGLGRQGGKKEGRKKRRGKTVSWFWHSKTLFKTCNNLLLHYNELCVFFWGADLTSTSYVYSSLVQDDSSRVVGSTAINSTISDLSVRDVQVTDHIPFRGDNLADAMTAILHNGIFIQCPSDGRQGGPLHIAHKGDWLARTHHFLTEGRNDFGSTICQGREKKEKNTYMLFPLSWSLSQDKIFFRRDVNNCIPGHKFTYWEMETTLVVVDYLSNSFLTERNFPCHLLRNLIVTSTEEKALEWKDEGSAGLYELPGSCRKVSVIQNSSIMTCNKPLTCSEFFFSWCISAPLKAKDEFCWWARHYLHRLILHSCVNSV